MNRPGYVEIIKQNYNQNEYRSLDFELINLPLYKGGSVEIDLPDSILQFTRVSNYGKIRHLMAGLKTSGVLCYTKAVFSQALSQEAVEDFVFTLCGLLGFSQCVYVWPVARYYKDLNEVIVRYVYEEPVFYNKQSAYPLIAIDDLNEFIQSTLEHYDNLYETWNLGAVIDYYLQAMFLTSAWPKSVCFFTALETIK